MKKLLSLILALALALAGTAAAFAEDAAPAEEAAQAAALSYGAGTVTIKATLSQEWISAMSADPSAAADEAAGSQAAQLGLIASVLNSLVITAASDGANAELVLSMKDQPVAGFGVAPQEDKLLILSDLFPNYAIAVDSAAAGGMMPQISADPEQMAALLAPFTKLVAELQAKAGEPEEVDEAMYGAQFTVKTPINVTVKEAELMALNAVKEMASQEAFTSIVAELNAKGMNIQLTPEQIDEQIEEITNKADEEFPALDAASYANQAGDAVMVLLLTQDDQAVTLAAGSIAGGVLLDVDAGDLVKLFVQGAGDSMVINFSTLAQGGMKVEVEGGIDQKDGVATAAFLVKLAGAEAGTLTIEAKPEAALSGAYTAEGKTEIAVTELQDTAGEAYQSFITDFSIGMLGVMSKIATAVPEIAPLFQQLLPAPAQEAPAAEPAAAP